jgi:hypothetical protein
MDIFLAIPCHTGNIVAECEVSILRNTHLLRDLGHTVIPYYLPGNIYLDKARNKCVKRFLESECTDLIFVDSDISFEDDAIVKLIKHDKDIVAGVYPLKQDFLEFPMQLYYDKDNNFLDEESGLITANMVPTGLMRIKREVFEKMRSFDWIGDKYRIQEDHEGIWTYFNTGILFEDDNTWWGEDVAFCRYWKLHGGRIYIEPNITFGHVGKKVYSGNLYNYLMDRRVEKIKDVAGWTSENELKKLAELSSQCSSAVEIGCWKGQSTKVLLDNCPKVYAVDHWMGSDGDMTGAIEDNSIYEDFLKNVGDYPNLEILKGSSLEIVKGFNKEVDMGFIDATHIYAYCKADIEAWLPKCKKFICGHDYCDEFPGVIQAVNEKFGKPNVIDSLWWVEL